MKNNNLINNEVNKFQPSIIHPFSDEEIAKRARKAGVMNQPSTSDSDLDVNEKEFTAFFRNLVDEERVKLNGKLSEIRREKDALINKTSADGDVNNMVEKECEIDQQLVSLEANNQEKLKQLNREAEDSLRRYRFYQSENGLEAVAPKEESALQHWGMLSVMILMEWITLTSSNAIIPIAYYLKRIGSQENFYISKDYEEDRVSIFKWLRMALLKRAFSGQPDNVLRPIREVLKESVGGFPIDAILNKFRGSPKALAFDEDELINLTSYEYGEPYTYSALAFLYPSLDFRNRFHLDHIYPKWMFSKKELLNQGIAKEDIATFLESYNSLSNLQLLEGVPNQEKSGKRFDQWILDAYPDESSRRAYMKKNFIPDIDLTLQNFPKFIELRRALLVAEFQKLLG